MTDVIYDIDDDIPPPEDGPVPGVEFTMRTVTEEYPLAAQGAIR